MNGLKNRIKQINNAVVDLFNAYGFKKKHKTVSDSAFEYVFTRDDLFVIFNGSCHPYDYPGFINVIVGRGDHTYPALDKNGRALWRIARCEEKTDEFSEYKFEDIYDDAFPDKLKADVNKYLKVFLTSGIGSPKSIYH